MGQSRTVVLTLVVGIVVACSSVGMALGAMPSSQGSPIGGFAWLEGEWKRPMSAGTAFERWRLVSGLGLVGESTMLPNGEVEEVHTEALLLVEMGSGVYYIPLPSQNEYPVGFRLVSHADGTAIFENPTHDFPQRIIYQRTSDDGMTVTIEGPGDGGKVQRIDFRFVREPARGAR